MKAIYCEIHVQKHYKNVACVVLQIFNIRVVKKKKLTSIKHLNLRITNHTIKHTADL